MGGEGGLNWLLKANLYATFKAGVQGGVIANVQGSGGHGWGWHQHKSLQASHRPTGTSSTAHLCALDDDCVCRQVDSPSQSGCAHQDLQTGENTKMCSRLSESKPPWFHSLHPHHQAPSSCCLLSILVDPWCCLLMHILILHSAPSMAQCTPTNPPKPCTA